MRTDEHVVKHSSNDLTALCICWASAVMSAAAIVGGFQSTSALLLVSSLAWAVAAVWIGGWAASFKLPILQYRSDAAPRKSSVLARPMLEAAFVLFTQAFLMPFYRAALS